MLTSTKVPFDSSLLVSEQPRSACVEGVAKEPWIDVKSLWKVLGRFFGGIWDPNFLEMSHLMVFFFL